MRFTRLLALLALVPAPAAAQGIEPAPCPPRYRCGYRGVASERVKVVRLRHAAGVRARDFELVCTPSAPRNGN